VGVVGGIVGVIGGLGGFVGPIIFGYLLRGTGLWTTCWMFFLGLSVVCLLWLHLVVRRMTQARTPGIADHFEDAQQPVGNAPAAAQSRGALAPGKA
jgi:NNP family nitrate/nitrite transporter-like MFS transporter